MREMSVASRDVHLWHTRQRETHSLDTLLLSHVGANGWDASPLIMRSSSFIDCPIIVDAVCNGLKAAESLWTIGRLLMLWNTGFW